MQKLQILFPYLDKKVEFDRILLYMFIHKPITFQNTILKNPLDCPRAF